MFNIVKNNYSINSDCYDKEKVMLLHTVRCESLIYSFEILNKGIFIYVLYSGLCCQVFMIIQIIPDIF